MRTFLVVVALSMLSACAPAPVKKPAAPAAEAPNTPISNTAVHRRARPDRPGEYTAGGLYKPGVSDSGPAIPPDISALSEPRPQDEPRARYGNRSPYTVLGHSYHVMDSARGYVKRGTASWYGEKFHGRATSSLEPYDMYSFTAAHKTLPLPTFARVTNLENGRSVTVRINDRGPFYGDRLIDLSYAAAIKLGMHIKGTAAVEVRALGAGATAATVAPTRAAMTAPIAARSTASRHAVDTWLQVASFGDRVNAKRLVERLKDADVERVKIQRKKVRGDHVYRVRIGPLAGREIAERLAAQVRALGLGQPTLMAE